MEAVTEQEWSLNGLELYSIDVNQWFPFHCIVLTMYTYTKCLVRLWAGIWVKSCSRESNTLKTCFTHSGNITVQGKKIKYWSLEMIDCQFHIKWLDGEPTRFSAIVVIMLSKILSLVHTSEGRLEFLPVYHVHFTAYELIIRLWK